MLSEYIRHVRLRLKKQQQKTKAAGQEHHGVENADLLWVSGSGSDEKAAGGWIKKEVQLDILACMLIGPPLHSVFGNDLGIIRERELV